MMKFAVIVNLASATAALHLDENNVQIANSTLETMSSCEPDGYCSYDREYAPTNCCSGCYHGSPASQQLCTPAAPWVCTSCDAEDAVKLSETESTAGSAVEEMDNGRNVDASATAALHLDENNVQIANSTLESMSSCEPDGYCSYDREYAQTNCCSGCYHGSPASQQLCTPAAPWVCTSCDAEDAVKLSDEDLYGDAEDAVKSSEAESDLHLDDNKSMCYNDGICIPEGSAPFPCCSGCYQYSQICHNDDSPSTLRCVSCDAEGAGEEQSQDAFAMV